MNLVVGHTRSLQSGERVKGDDDWGLVTHRTNVGTNGGAVLKAPAGWAYADTTRAITLALLGPEEGP